MPITESEALNDPVDVNTPSLPPLTLELFRDAATDFAETFNGLPFPDLYGASDGKAVGTRVEALFKSYLQERFDLEVGNAANGLDFPTLNLDLKVTSYRQPQSSSPFKAATQKIYGLGYNLLVVVYTKHDDHETQSAVFEIHHVIYIDKKRTGDFRTTSQILEILDDAPSDDIAIEELDALLENRNLPLDEVSRRQLAERLLVDRPEQGYLTISNALQWRLQYGRAISTATDRIVFPEVADLKKPSNFEN